MLYFDIFTTTLTQIGTWIPSIVALWVFADLFVSMIFKDR